MGALLSLPLLAIPSLGTVLSVGASCCGAATCSALCSACGKCQNSVMTRIGYAILLLVNSIVSWLMLTDWAIKKLEHLTMDYMKLSCVGKECYGFVAVHRMNFALGTFHFLMAVLLVGVNSSRDKRAPIQNSFWGPKIIAWLGLIVVSFFIPDSFFVAWGNYVALVGAMLFLLLGLVLLVDLAHTWAEHCLERIDTTESKTWQAMLIGSTLSMYLGTLAMTIVMYIFFAGAGCSMNQAAITVNLLLAIAITALSIHPTIQAYNPRAGLCQASMVAVYCTYLTMSAVGMEPDNTCNPLQRANGTRTASIVLGAFVTFLTMAWTTTRAATMGLAGSSVRNGGYGAVPSGDEEYTHSLVSTQPSSRRELRDAALRAAVNSGSLPASALDDADDDYYSDSEDGNGKKRDDERGGTQYNYSLFHVVFLLSTAWVATLLTQNITADKDLHFAPVGRSYWASWVKIVSSWVCYTIYSWSLAAPAVLPDRFDY
ncbi:putative membrane protein TMS1 [Microthyrium microscopicum]|uniref:Putative membrane protein TMS1 n=1 Tax=Microthyrium microscopicum TaxID=703497 RepID=A0A6A6U9C0_9PEZI|nr:putative membrane protein TMS1 [Microthyrium microscopicum]